MNRKKKLPVLKVAHRDEAGQVGESLPEEVTIALGDVAGAIREP